MSPASTPKPGDHTPLLNGHGISLPREGQPAGYCQQRVRECDSYLAVVGFRYGSLVPRETISYTELEFIEATIAGLPPPLTGPSGRPRRHDCGSSRPSPISGLSVGSGDDVPISPGLTPHGLRHSHRTHMEELRIEKVLMDERYWPS